MKRTQHAAHNPKFEKMGLFNIPGGGQNRLKDPPHMVEDGHHLRKAPNPHHYLLLGYLIGDVEANLIMCQTFL